jgi:membrane protease YdiL (CAAX protease family)
LIVIALRSLDLFVLRLEGLPDKIMLSRVLGFLLVLGYLAALRKPIRAIGLQAKSFDKAFLIGGLSLLVLYAALYGAQLYRLGAAGESPRLVFAAFDRERAAMAGSFFTLFAFSGQIVNALMEESIFRGVVLPQLMRRFAFWQANALQAILFGLAHLVFPLSNWVSGQATAREAAAEAASLMVFASIGGLIFGYLYYRTGNLWTAVFAHLADNAAGLFFHIQTTSRLNAETDILMLASIGFLALAPLAWAAAKRFRLTPLKPWGQTELGVRKIRP